MYRTQFSDENELQAIVTKQVAIEWITQKVVVLAMTHFTHFAN